MTKCADWCNGAERSRARDGARKGVPTAFRVNPKCVVLPFNSHNRKRKRWLCPIADSETRDPILTLDSSTAPGPEIHRTTRKLSVAQSSCAQFARRLCRARPLAPSDSLSCTCLSLPRPISFLTATSL